VKPPEIRAEVKSIKEITSNIASMAVLLMPPEGGRWSTERRPGKYKAGALTVYGSMKIDCCSFMERMNEC
jgi:hypothetical protein